MNYTLEAKFPQLKKYGAEGCDSAISGLEKLVLTAGKHKIKNIIQGNAHRGRFNTLTKMFGVPYELIFAEFMDIPNKNWR